MSICTYHYLPTNTTYVRVKYKSSIDLTFNVNILGFLTRSFPPHDLDLYQAERYAITDSHVPIVESVRHVFEIHLRNINLIADKWQWGGLGQGWSCFHNFTIQLQREAPQFVEVDLSHLGLDRVPFPLGLLRDTKRLDLSFNNIRILAIDLIGLTALEEIDLRGNPILEIPDWSASEMPNVKFLTDLPQRDPDDLTQAYS